MDPKSYLPLDKDSNNYVETKDWDSSVRRCFAFQDMALPSSSADAPCRYEHRHPETAEMLLPPKKPAVEGWNSRPMMPEQAPVAVPEGALEMVQSVMNFMDQNRTSKSAALLAAGGVAALTTEALRQRDKEDGYEDKSSSEPALTSYSSEEEAFAPFPDEQLSTNPGEKPAAPQAGSITGTATQEQLEYWVSNNVNKDSLPTILKAISEALNQTSSTSLELDLTESSSSSSERTSGAIRK